MSPGGAAAPTPSGPGGLEARVHVRIADVPGTWDALAPDDFFFQRAFLRVMAESGTEGARYRYLVLHRGAEPVGLAVLSAFTLALDLLSGDPWVARLRRWWPGLLDVPAVCCGIPASFGQHHMYVAPGCDREAAFREVDRQLEAWARERGAPVVLWKEWAPEAGIGGVARREGYAVLPTLPDHVVAPLPATPGAFLGRLRSAYRRKFRPATELLDGPGPVWTRGSLRLEEVAFDAAAAEAFHPGYRSVLGRAAARLETYPPAFFRELASSGLGARLLRLADGVEGWRIAALLVPGGDVLTFALLAKERPRLGGDAYPLLLRCLVLRAIAQGFGTLRLGQTSSYAKCAVGARARRLETFIRVRSGWKHRAFRAVGPHLFPETPSAELRVYRAGEPPPDAASGAEGAAGGRR